MQQLALDIAITPAPDLARFLSGENAYALSLLDDWLAQVGGQTIDPTPLYLWGPHTSGKTYLLQALRHRLLSLGLVSGWMDANSPEAALDEDWAAILLDDVSDYDATHQQQAFAWMAQAKALHIPCISTGRAAPLQLTHLREDLRNRLAWGHVQGLRLLNEEDRRLALQLEAQARGLNLSREVLDFMLRHFSRDLASQMSLLDSVDAFALHSKRSITVALIKDMLLAE